MSNNSESEDVLFEFDKVICLFCDEVFETTQSLVNDHLPNAHQFDFNGYVQNFSSYDLIKFVNYWRSTDLNLEVLENVLSEKVWDDDAFLKPVLEDDPMLYYNIDASMSFSDSEDDEFDALSKEELIQKLKELKEELVGKDSQLFQAVDLISKMQKFDEIEVANENMAVDLTVEDTYFQIYSSFKIHYDMLKDDIRTLAYKNFIYENSDYFKDKVVLDVGCGTGILSMFAAKSGAKHVYAIDRSSVIHQAISISIENGLDDKITFIHSIVEDVDTLGGNHEKVDIIISEWMGYCLLYESMLPSVLVAKEKFLKEDGRVFPDIATMLITGVTAEKYYKSKIGFWDDVYGFKMETMRNAVLEEAHVDGIATENIITSVETFKNFQLNEITADDLNFNEKFVLRVEKTETLHALMCYFDIYFQAVPNPVFFSTGPFTKDTHWGQSIFVLSEPLNVEEGDEIELTFDMREKSRRERQLFVQLTLVVESKGIHHTQGYQIT